MGRHILLKAPPLFAAFILSFLILTSGAYAIGITPSRIVLDFEPASKHTATFTVLNMERRAMSLSVYVKGELEDYVTCDTDEITFLATEPRKTFSCELTIPEVTGKYGILDTRVGVVEMIPSGGSVGGTLGARAGVEAQFWVKVPYPGKYLEVALSAPDVAVGELVPFEITVSNLGTESLAVSGIVEIYDSSGSKIDTLSAGQASVNQRESVLLKAEWDTLGAEAGQYRVLATVSYGEESVQAERNFRIGALLVEITDVPKVSVQQGGIAKLNVEVKSKWNVPIEGSYIEATISDITAKSETLTLESWKTTTIPVYIDTKDLEPGIYDIKLVLHYSGKTAERLVRNGLEIFQMPLTTILLGVLVIAILAAAGFLLYRKESKKSRKRK